MSRSPGTDPRLVIVAFVALLHVCAIAPARAAELVLGEHEALSGQFAHGGQGMHEGLVLAVKEYNRRQKVHVARLVTIDDQSDPAKAAAAVSELLGKGIFAFVGGMGTNVVGAGSETAVRGGAVYLTAGAPSKTLIDRNYDRFFSLTNTAGYAVPWFKFLPSVGVKRVSIVAMTLEGPQAVTKDLVEGLGRKGIEVTVHGFDRGLEDFKPILNLVKLRDRADAALIAAYEKENLAFARAAQVVRPDVKVLGGTSGWAYDSMIQNQGPLMRSTVGGALISSPPEFADDEGRRFLEAFQEEFKVRPDYTSVWSYEVGLLMLEAMERAHASGHLDPQTTARCLRNDGKPRRTITGPVTFDGTGYNSTFSFRIVQHVAGGTRIVWPPDAAQQKPVMPARPW